MHRLSLDLDAIDEAEVDDVDPQLGVVDVLQCLEDLLSKHLRAVSIAPEVFGICDGLFHGCLPLWGYPNAAAHEPSSNLPGSAP